MAQDAGIRHPTLSELLGDHTKTTHAALEAGGAFGPLSKADSETDAFIRSYIALTKGMLLAERAISAFDLRAFTKNASDFHHISLLEKDLIFHGQGAWVAGVKQSRNFLDTSLQALGAHWCVLGSTKGARVIATSMKKRATPIAASIQAQGMQSLVYRAAQTVTLGHPFSQDVETLSDEGLDLPEILSGAQKTFLLFMDSPDFAEKVA
jgi:heme oxygenase